MLRQVAFGLAGLTGLLLAAAIGGASCQWIVTRSELAATPPPGKLVDVGGHRLHIWCTGSGSPAVILDDGLGGSSFGWGYVQPEVAKFTQVCSYDRAGLGYSDPGPKARTSRQVARELAALLDRSGVRGRVVLVGASIGGLHVRLFATEHRERAAGLVLVDASHEDYRERAAAAGEETDPPLVARLQPLAASVGLMRLFGIPSGQLVGPFNAHAFAPAVRPYARAVSFRTSGYRAIVDEFNALAESEAQVRVGRRELSIPVIVVSAGLDGSAVHQALQREQARLSTRGCQIIAERSFHVIARDQPEVVVDAIRAAVDAVRRDTAPIC